MTALFDGLAQMLSDTFGDTHTHRPAGGAERSIQGVFRSEPVEVVDDARGAVLMLSPSLKVTKSLADGISVGDRIVAEGSEYTVLNKLPSGSPADDAFVFIELEDLL